jgi:hypothetical protein
MRKELNRILPIILLLTSGCGTKTPDILVPTPLPPDQLKRETDILFQVIPPQCRDPKTISLASMTPRNVGLASVACSTMFEDNHPLILCAEPEQKNNIQLTFYLAHEAGHSCGDLSSVEEQIQTILNYQTDDTTSVTISRNIDDQTDKGPYIDLTIITKKGAEQTKRFFDFEEMITYYFGLATLEADFGIDSPEYLYAEKYNSHRNSTHVINALLKSAGTTIDEVAYLKKRADANGLINRLQEGLINIGIQYGLTDEKRPSDPDREKYYLLEFLGNSFNAENFKIEDLSKNYTDYYKKELSQFYFGQNFESLTEDKKNLINKIIFILFGHSQTQGYFPGSLDITLADGTIVEPTTNISSIGWQEVTKDVAGVGDGAVIDQICYNNFV